MPQKQILLHKIRVYERKERQKKIQTVTTLLLSTSRILLENIQNTSKSNNFPEYEDIYIPPPPKKTPKKLKEMLSILDTT